MAQADAVKKSSPLLIAFAWLIVIVLPRGTELHCAERDEALHYACTSDYDTGEITTALSV